jgi:protein-tyrosine phosphatase
MGAGDLTPSVGHATPAQAGRIGIRAKGISGAWVTFSSLPGRQPSRRCSIKPENDGHHRADTGPESKVLFLCTGNYYRSRFAEALFNARAAKMGLAWRARSRGLATERGIHNPGAISAHALKGLASRGITPPRPRRYPLQVLEMDLREADLVVALKEEEHRPLFEERFPTWGEQVEYWQVHDLDRASASDGLAEIERQVEALLRRLGPMPFE